MIVRAVIRAASKVTPVRPSSEMAAEMFAAASADTSAGVRVTPEGALRVGAIYAAISIIAETIGSLPSHVFSKAGRYRQPAANHPAAPVLTRQANPELTAGEFWEQMAGWKLLRGNALAYVESNQRGAPTALWPIPWTRVRPARTPSGDPAYLVNLSGGAGNYAGSTFPLDEQVVLLPSEVLHFRDFGFGAVGISRVQLMAETAGLAIAAEQYGSTYFANDATPGGFISVPQKLNDDEWEELRGRWNELHRGGRRSHMVGILESGADWKQAGLSAKDAQLVELRGFEIEEIARWFRVPLHMIQHVSPVTSWGCVVPGTSLIRRDGARVRADAVDVGEELLGWDPSTARYVSTRVRGIGRTLKPMVRVRTVRGRMLEVTVDHPFWAITATYPTRHKEILRSAGSWVHACELTTEHAVKVALDYTTDPSVLGSPELAWLAGLAIGDGHMTGADGQLTIAVPSAAIGDRITEIATDQLGTTVRTKIEEWGSYLTIRKGPKQSRGSVTRVGLFLEALGMRGVKAKSKHVPGFIFRAPDKEAAAFLAGYLDADGTVTPTAVIWSSVSRDLLEGAQDLLARLGVQSSLRLAQRAHRHKVPGRWSQALDLFNLKVGSKAGTARLAALLDLADPAKAERLARFASPAGEQRPPAFFEYDRIAEVVEIPLQETIAIELDAPHTHVTAGLVSHNTGIEQLGIGFVTYTLSTHMNRFEEVAGARLLAPDGSTFMRFNVDGLLRGDQASRYAAYAIGKQWGFLSTNDVRAREDMPPVEGGDTYWQPLNFIPAGTDVAAMLAIAERLGPAAFGSPEGIELPVTPAPASESMTGNGQG